LSLRQKQGDTIVFSASTKEEKTCGLKPKFTKSIAVKIPRDSFRSCLRNAAQQFVEKRNGETFIIAGYPWFGPWGRDTFIALPGLALAVTGLNSSGQVLNTQVSG
jgi:glycogen debranching enzyme